MNELSTRLPHDYTQKNALKTLTKMGACVYRVNV